MDGRSGEVLRWALLGKGQYIVVKQQKQNNGSRTKAITNPIEVSVMGRFDLFCTKYDDNLLSYLIKRCTTQKMHLVLSRVEQ